MRTERARFGDRPLPDPEIALGVLRAPVERLSASLLRAHFDDVSAALRTRNPQRNGLRVLAAGVAAAGEKLPVATVADGHRLSALVALVVGELRLFGLFA